ncbi:hypothetical protein AAW14_18850 [Streptomyces hygroscopicus]|uniref:DUF3995 domain-containing protein n=1 Tax=Streptomyces hygroscopicus TaxID=1912 RepID=UPI00223ECF61|nr:DUF3995 domain-containing protein [Streptomyces hygroscopicus]MCW7944046.1 hypothetical protein [Streptomyces hygroscopicus]
MSTNFGPIAKKWGYLACGWGVLFAGLHYYWAVGGQRWLNVSAGERLAAERPAWFVITGLWGVGTLCLVGALLGLLLTRPRPHRHLRRIMRWLGWGVCGLLLVRGLTIEVLLLTDVTHMDADVSASQRAWTLALWNPWFIAGGLAFGLAAHHFGRAHRTPVS